jgi:hypothetical protein
MILLQTELQYRRHSIRNVIKPGVSHCVFEKPLRDEVNLDGLLWHTT